MDGRAARPTVRCDEARSPGLVRAVLAEHASQIRKRYGFDAYRKQTLLRARRFVNDVLLDQIPVLADLQRFMDQRCHT